MTYAELQENGYVQSREVLCVFNKVLQGHLWVD
jgi:hypothetical protein